LKISIFSLKISIFRIAGPAQACWAEGSSKQVR